MDIGLNLLGGNPNGYYEQDPETKEKLVAYWHLTHATEQVGRSAGMNKDLTPSDLRRVLARPASLGDLLESWLITHPRQGGVATLRNDNGAVRRGLKKGGASDDALDFWLGGD